MVDFVVGACAVALVSWLVFCGVACLVAWAYQRGFDDGFVAGARAERSDLCERALKNSEERRS